MPGEHMDVEQLMGKKDMDGNATPNGGIPADGKLEPMLWGVPGYLTKEQADIYVKFRAEVEKRGGDFKSTIYSFGEEEGECWALCRWLRARKFVYDDVITMIEEATQVRSEAKKNDFYPDPKAALGCDATLYYAQFPQLYTGYAKNGVPLFISKAGVLNTDAVECITTLDGILKFHWFIMMHDFGDRLRNQKKEDPKFSKFQFLTVLDLANLTTAQLSSKALAIIKEQAKIDSLCFPETMYKMVIVNAPVFFTATWRLIKGWLDPRTTAKIDVISSRTKWEEKLKELVDVEQLPSDYGGKGPNTVQSLDATSPGDMKRLRTVVLACRSHTSTTFDVEVGEVLDINMWTRCVGGAKVGVFDASKNPIVENVEVKHVGADDAASMPTETKITEEKIVGPKSIKVKLQSNSGRMSLEKYLVAFCVYPN